LAVVKSSRTFSADTTADGLNVSPGMRWQQQQQQERISIQNKLQLLAQATCFIVMSSLTRIRFLL
jgi:hypothetical protein